MKHINKILLVAGFAMGIGGCAISTSSNLVGASAKVASTDTISSSSLDAVSDGQYVVIGDEGGTKFVSTCESNWLKCSTTQTNYVKYQVEQTTDGFYLKDTDTDNYIYSTGAKNISMSTSKTLITLDESSGRILVGGVYLGFNSTGYRPYAASSYDGAFLYEVSSVSVESISIKTQPNKTSYREGEKFDPTGLVVTVTYSDETTDDIDTGYTYEPTDGLTSSCTAVTISYKNKTASVPVTVASLSSLTYEGTPTHTEYNAKESFDCTGITVYANYSNGDKVDVTEFIEWSTLEQGDESATGTYGGKTITIGGLVVKALPAYIKVTDVSKLSVGDNLIITNSDSKLAAGEYVAGTKPYFAETEVEEVDDMIVPTEKTTIFTLGKSDSKWTLHFSEGYLKFTEADNGKIGVDDIEEGSLTDQHRFTISNSLPTSSPEMRINNVSLSGRGIRYNKSATRFTNYDAASQGNINIYIKSAGTVEDVITGITLNPSEDKEISLGSSLSVTPTVTGGDEADMTVVWSLSKTGIVTLGDATTESGETLVVTPNEVGEVTLTGTCVGDTSFSASIKITVVDPNSVSSVEIEHGVAASGICHVDNTKTLTADILPESAVNKNVTWASSDTSVATINETTGVVNSIKPGRTTITATSVLTNTVSDTIDFIVFSQKGTKTTCPLAPTDINNGLTLNTWTYDVDAQADEEYTGSYYIEGIVAEEPDIKNDKYSFKMVDEWGGEIYISKMSSSETISMSDKVMVFAAKTNISNIDGVDIVANGSLEGTPTPAPIEITGIELSGPTSVKVGKTITLNPTLTPSYTTQRTLVWSSDDETVATVSNGVVTGVKEGTAVITAKSSVKGTVSATYTVTVTSASAIAGKYTFVSNTTTYVQPAASQVTNYLEGFDLGVFQSGQNSDVRFGCSGHTNEIFIGYEGAFSFGLSWDVIMDYTIAKVTFKGVKGDGGEAAISSKVQGYDEIYSFPVGGSGEDFSFYPFSYMVTSYGAELRNLYCEAIEVEVAAIDDTDTLANHFNQAILDLTSKDCSALNVRTSTWEYIKLCYSNLVDEAYGINPDAVLGIKNATASQSGNLAEQAAARYDYILGIYGTVKYANFLSRTITPIGGRLVARVGTNVYLTALIIASAVIVIAAVALILIKKKKHAK